MRNKTYGIGEASLLTKVSERQLRRWETEGYLRKIKRIVCGERAYRRYSGANIKQIKEIKKYLDEGYTLAAAVQKELKNSHKEGQ